MLWLKVLLVIICILIGVALGNVTLSGMAAVGLALLIVFSWTSVRETQTGTSQKRRH